MKITDKIMSAAKARAIVEQLQSRGGKVAFTNGCFDILHQGHVRFLNQARGQGEMLVVGLNSDDSVRSLDKGGDRPITPASQRAEILASLMAVSLVVVFEEPTPLELIEIIRPDVLIKGGDWAPDQIVGSDFVLAQGGEVMSLPLVPGISTTAIIERIRAGRS